MELLTELVNVDLFGQHQYSRVMTSSDATSLHELLRGLRESKGQSLRDAARDLAVDPAYLSRIERGTKPASSAVLERASVYYDVPEELLALSRGIVPTDITGILQSYPELLPELRSRYGPS
jgi:transcriptional regulator with XRE-family HTH domain